MFKKTWKIINPGRFKKDQALTLYNKVLESSFKKKGLS